MKTEIADLWTAALESGEYSQTTNHLRNSTGFCCLGVLCDLYQKETGLGKWEKTATQNGDWFMFNTGSDVSAIGLPIDVMNWSGMTNSAGLPNDAETTDEEGKKDYILEKALVTIEDFNEGDRPGVFYYLSSLNDLAEYDFKQIAEVIKKNVERL